MNHLANHVHATGTELHQVAAVAGTAQSTLSSEHDAGASRELARLEGGCVVVTLLFSQ